MKVYKAEFSRSVFSLEYLPKDTLPQIAFAGRSNVGKSTMINCLLQQKNLARISSRPGKTRSINFLKINDRFYFVDLPGYGYARVAKQERQKWKTLLETFFTRGSQIRGLIHIIDARIGVTDTDEQMISFAIACGLRPVVVATKSDKLTQKAKASQWKKISQQLHRFDLKEFIPFSARTHEGKREVWRWIETRLG